MNEQKQKNQSKCMNVCVCLVCAKKMCFLWLNEKS
jgi:hypothetical protein